MKHLTKILMTTAVLALGANSALAAGKLHIYNWGDYLNPEMIKKFETKYDVKVSVDSYDSNETMMSKVRAGSSGYDIVVPSDYAVQVMIGDGLLEKTMPNKMENFKNVKPEMVDVYYDKGREYTVPWQVGITAFSVDTAVYGGDINTLSIIFNPPEELKGKINMLDDITLTMHMAERYVGVPRCATEKADLKKVSEALMTAKPHWKTFSYDTLGLLSAGDVAASTNWNGYSYRARAKRSTVKFAYPKEGVEIFIDNVAVLKDAPNMDNAKLFQNFMMDPEMAGLNSSYNAYPNGIVGADAFMPKEISGSPEFNYPADAPKPELVPPCSAETVEIYNQIWTELKK